MTCDSLNIYRLDHLALQLGIAADELLSVSTNIKEHYRKEVKPICKDGKLKKSRGIYHPSRRLKKIIIAIDRRLLKKLALPACMHGSIKKKSHISNARVHLRQPYICGLDIQNFFPSVTQNHVYNLFRHRLKCSNAISRLLVKLCTADNHVPQGYNTSSSIANLVLIPVAEQIQALCDKLCFRITIQVDDITISGHKNPEPYLVRFENILAKAGFEINSSKTTCQKWDERQEVTGIIVNRKSNITKEAYKNLRSMIHICRRFGPNTLLQKSIIKDRECDFIKNPDKLRSYLLGKLNYLKQVNPQKAIALGQDFEQIVW